MDEQNIMQNSNSKKHFFLPVLLSVLITFLVTVIAIFLFLQKYNSLDSTLKFTIKNEHVKTTPQKTSTVYTNPETNQSFQIVYVYETIYDVTWTEPQKLDNLKLLSDYYPDENPTEYYKVGTINNGTYKGGDIILAASPLYGEGSDPFVFDRFIRFNDQNIILTKYSAEKPDQYNIINPDKTQVAKHIIISDLEYPGMILDDKRNVYTLGGSSFFYGSFPNDTTKWQKFFDNPFVGSVSIIPQEFKDGSFRHFYVTSPDHTKVEYIYQPDFYFSYSNISPSEIIWNDGTINTTTYNKEPLDGCMEGNPYLKVLQDNPISISDLKKVGTFKNGDPIYTFKNKDNIYNQSLQARMDAPTEPNIIIWQDPFGRLINFVWEMQSNLCAG